jgi:hypothetical protein
VTVKPFTTFLIINHLYSVDEFNAIHEDNTKKDEIKLCMITRENGFLLKSESSNKLILIIIEIVHKKKYKKQKNLTLLSILGFKYKYIADTGRYK